MLATITSKGQATIPKALRDRLKLKSGDQIKWFINVHGELVGWPVLPVRALRGIVKSDKRFTIDQLNDAVANGAASRHRKFLKQK